MARGWESKSIEEQMAAAAERQTSSAPPRSAREREIAAERATLELSRRKVLSDLAKARDGRHREALQQALRFLDARIEALA
jgi:hypothetical protein